jgi:homoserine kinase type II
MAFLPAPKVTKTEIEKHLFEHFNLGKLLSYKKLKKGLANCIYHIKTTKGDFAFKISIRHNSKKINYEIKLLNTIHGLPIPKPIKTKNGKYLFDYKGHKTFIYPFLPGKEEKKFTQEMLFEVGKFLGKLHLQTEGFSSPVRRTNFYGISYQGIKRIVQESRYQKNLKIKKAVFYLKENALKYKLSAGLPLGAMHIDLKPENTLFAKGKLAGVVDFDNSYNGPLIFDLADTLAWFCSKKGNFNINEAKKIYQGYKSVRKLTTKEQQTLFDALHKVLCAIVLCGIDYLNHKKLPEKYIIWLIDNLLETEKNLKLTREQFQKIFR